MIHSAKTYPSICRTIALSVFLLLASYTHVQAQSGLKKLFHIPKEDSIPLFRGVQIKADLVGVTQLMISDYGQYEAGVRVNLKDRYFPTFEAGWGRAAHHDIVTKLSYKTAAPYGKLGCDFNVLKNKHGVNRFYVGMRYAYTNYKFDIDHPDVTDPIWGETASYTAQNVKADCHWIELLAAIDTKISGPLRLGWSVRYKKRIKYDNGSVGNSWYVPGYGKQGPSVLGGTFDIILQF